MYKHLFFILLICLAVFLASCAEEAPAPELQPGEVSVTPADDTEGTITVNGNRITITSLSYWQSFNHDGNFSDNCLEFLRNFIENDSELYEFNTVQIRDWEIIRDPEKLGYDLAFNFTVVQSELQTLPIGRYETVVKDAVDCYMLFSGKDPTNIFPTVQSSTEASAVVSAWLHSTYSWYIPEYGTADAISCIRYLIDRYSDGERIRYEDFKKLASEKIGISAEKESLSEYLAIENDQLYVLADRIGGNTTFRITGEEKKEGYTSVTVQFFADCNGFVLSDVIEYHIGEKEELLGCTVLKTSPYSPYGLRNAFRK